MLPCKKILQKCYCWHFKSSMLPYKIPLKNIILCIKLKPTKKLHKIETFKSGGRGKYQTFRYNYSKKKI